MNRRIEPDDARLPFIVLACGRFAPSQVRVRHDPAPRETTDEIESLIAVEWDRRIAEAKAADRLLFNGEMLRYVDHTVVDGGPVTQFRMTVGPTCYRDFVGTNLYNSHRLAEFGWQRFSNPVGTTATLISRDGLICYGRRSQRVAFHAGHVHTFGGALEAADRSADGGVDPFASVSRELCEELGLERGELCDLECVGLIRDRQINQPEMLFEARLALSAAELRRRWQSAEARDEHDDLVTLADEPEAIVPFINTCGLIAPVAVGALLIRGQLKWGAAWLQSACTGLRADVGR